MKVTSIWILQKAQFAKIESINRQIEVIRNLLGGMSYRPLDMWEHLKEVLDDPHALVIANPPTYFSGYEKFYDTQGKMTWKEPPYELFDPETGHQQFYDLCMNAKALVICYQEKRVGEAVGYTIYARSGTRADLNAYITTNREEEATALANGKKIKRPAESKLQPLDCSMLPRDYEIEEDSKVQVIPIKAAEAQYYRELWTHNFVGSSATFNRALLIDGYVAGVFGISKMASDSVFVWYVMKVPHKTYRLGRLCYMLAQNRAFVDTLLDNIEQEKVTKMRTAMLTRYPENKEVRGIMKLVNRVEDKKNGYKLTYEAGEFYYNDPEHLVVRENEDPRRYFENVAEDHILSMAFEGSVCHMLWYGTNPGIKKKFDRIFEKRGIYYEFGDHWNFTCYYIGE